MSENANQLHVRFVTPERSLVDQAVDSVLLPSKTGCFEVLYGHTPLVAELGAGDVILRGGSEGDATYNVSWGFVEVLPDRVTILASDALKPEEIDVPRANQQLDRGLDLWAKAGESEEAYSEAIRVIAEAEAKLASAEQTDKH
jgi:F-type H+-transporting ATPase subunit epsilon